MTITPKLTFKPRRMFANVGPSFIQCLETKAGAIEAEENVGEDGNSEATAVATPVLVLPADPASIEALRMMLADKLAITSLTVESAYAGSSAILAAIGFKLPKAK